MTPRRDSHTSDAEHLAYAGARRDQGKGLAELIRWAAPFFSAAVITLAMLQVVSVFLLGLYSRYLGQAIELLLSIGVHVVLWVLAAGVLLLVVRYRGRGVVPTTTRRQLAIGGIVIATSVWLPQTLDMALAVEMDRWGSPVTTGYGTVISWIVLVLIPMSVGLRAHIPSSSGQ